MQTHLEGVRRAAGNACCLSSGEVVPGDQQQRFTLRGRKPGQRVEQADPVDGGVLGRSGDGCQPRRDADLVVEPLPSLSAASTVSDDVASNDEEPGKWVVGDIAYSTPDNEEDIAHHVVRCRRIDVP